MAVSFYSTTTSIWVHISLHPHQHLLLFVFLIIAILVGVVSLWFLFVLPVGLMMLSVFSCVNWQFMHLLWGNVDSDPLPILKLGCLLLSCKSSLCIIDTSTLADLWFVNIFSHFLGYLFILFYFSLLCMYWMCPLNCKLNFSLWDYFSSSGLLGLFYIACPLQTFSPFHLF